MLPKFFATPAAWRAWLEKHHREEKELLVGFYKRDSGKPSITWPESVDAALCFGWIDGVRRGINVETYSIRFTPRKPRSIWSVVNINRVAELSRQKLMHAAGLAAFEARQEARSGVYSFEQQHIAFEPAQEKLFRASRSAWKYFQSRAPSYQRAATWWVINARRPETRASRLASLMKVSEQNETLPHLTPRPPNRKPVS